MAFPISSKKLHKSLHFGYFWLFYVTIPGNGGDSPSLFVPAVDPEPVFVYDTVIEKYRGDKKI